MSSNYTGEGRKRVQIVCFEESLDKGILETEYKDKKMLLLAKCQKIIRSSESNCPLQVSSHTDSADETVTELDGS